MKRLLHASIGDKLIMHSLCIHMKECCILVLVPNSYAFIMDIWKYCVVIITRIVKIKPCL